jgi:hypothetical protein
VNGNLKRLKHHFDYRFTGVPSLKVLDFLHTLKEALDINRISEGAAVLVLPHLLDGEARDGVQALWKRLPASMPKYPAAVNWLLESFATETAMDEAARKFLTARQLPGESEETFAARLRKHASEAGNVFGEDQLVTVFVAGLQPYAANTVRGQITSTTNFAQVRNLAIQAGAAGRARTSTREPVPGVVPVRSKASVAAYADSSRASSMDFYDYDVYPGSEHPAVVGAVDHPSSAERSSEVSGPVSDVSFPTRGWVSAAGSVRDDPILALAMQPRGCYLCFGQDHFLMECPLLGEDTKVAGQKQRELHFRGPVMSTSAAPTPPVAKPRSSHFVTSQARPPFRPAIWQTNPRYASPMKPHHEAAAVHHVEASEEIPKRADTHEMTPKPAENEAGDV